MSEPTAGAKPLSFGADDIGGLALSRTGVKLAQLVGQYSNAAALIMVGWVLYQTIGVELPAMREQTYIRTQAIITTMERMRDSMDNNVKMLQDAKEFQREMMRLHTEQTKVLMELTREIREMKKPAGAGG